MRKRDYVKMLKAKQETFREVFTSPAGKEVFLDLFNEFFKDSPIGPDGKVDPIRVGKAEAFRYIMVTMEATIKDMEVLYGGRQPEWDPER